ncbi:unnamed protein product [Cuscuta campestris]|uniref:Reverse transcriptase domain-containing protein n=1 Tax=Cuscuta campestris TaxID=132261 RepID=A0A484LS81_9ASTE|nr:unnamed protein product [Cuscuta campestris]
MDEKLKEHKDMTIIKQMAIDYYSKLYNNSKDVDMEPVLHYLDKPISHQDNINISKVPNEEEIKEAVWSLNPNSAPGPDGFNGSFFRACWHIIKDDVVSAAQEFFVGVPVPKSYGSTFITLIPKNDSPKRFGDYRPISLSTFMSKINTRILADRLQMILPKIISKEQTGFQKGMGVDEQILLVEEMVHKIDAKIRGGNVIIKLDMAKAFDNMEWHYILGVLDKLGFSDHNQKLLLANLRSTFISVMVNGSPQGFFTMKRGVKQGDPLSPLLFIIAGEGLSRMLKQNMASSKIVNYNTGRDYLISHLAYADDIISFCNGDTRNLLKVNTLLKSYMNASDSPARKRICRIHMISGESMGDMLPEDDEVVKIKLKHAYESCRPHNNMAISDKFCWNNLQIPRVKLFLWKLNDDILPFPDVLSRMSYSLPSQCPFCKKNEATVDHCILQCGKIRYIWDEIADIIEGPRIRPATTIKQHILKWHLRSETHTLRGNMKLVMPGVIAWCIWKQYSAISFGNEDLNTNNIIYNIKSNMNLWNWKYRNKGWMIRDESLVNSGIQIFALGGKSIATTLT